MLHIFAFNTNHAFILQIIGRVYTGKWYDVGAGWLANPRLSGGLDDSAEENIVVNPWTAVAVAGWHTELVIEYSIIRGMIWWMDIFGFPPLHSASLPLDKRMQLIVY